MPGGKGENGAQYPSILNLDYSAEYDEKTYNRRIIDPMRDCLEDLRSPAHTKNASVQMVHQSI